MKDPYDMEKMFLISPVRGLSKTATYDLRDFIADKIESDYVVHWPLRDTQQEGDPTGLRICQHNIAAIKRADVVGIIWDGKSRGCLFDLGMAFALNKEVKIYELPDATEGKSFQNMIREWSGLDYESFRPIGISEKLDATTAAKR